MDNKEFNEKYESLKKSKFRQQKLLGWRPIPTLSCVTIIFISFAVFFILVGILILVFTSQVKELVIRYDKLDVYDNETDLFCNYEGSDVVCRIEFQEKMKKPIMIYYQIDGFSQNHRAYMDSKSEKQIQGDSDDNLKKICESAYFNKDMKKVLSGKGEDVAFPCGLIANSYFNQNFTDWTINEAPIYFKFEDIVYETEKEKYKKIKYEESKHWINFNDEHFMIWMRTNPFPNPRKLWGIFDEFDIEKGSKLKFNVEKVDTSFTNDIGSRRYVILSTRNVFGGKSSFLGLCYLIFGIICLATSIIFINLYHIFHKK